MSDLKFSKKLNPISEARRLAGEENWLLFQIASVLGRINNISRTAKNLGINFSAHDFQFSPETLLKIREEIKHRQLERKEMAATQKRNKKVGYSSTLADFL